MSVQIYRARRASILGGAAVLALLGAGSAARGQDQPAQQQPSQNQPGQTPSAPAAPAPAAAPQNSSLPQINVTAAKEKPAPRQVVRRTPVPATAPASSTVPAVSPTEQLTQQSNSFDQARSNLFTTIGTTSATMSHQNIQNLPQGTDQAVEKVLLQFPGVSQDSAASGDLHIRNDHANAQVRINGIMMPDGVTGFSSFLDPSWIGSLSLVTGALPAEYGLRTTGLIDITTRTDIFNNSGSISVYGGSRSTITPSIEYGGTFGANCPAGTPASKSSSCYGGVQYFFTGRYLQTQEGIENPLPTLNAIHDFSRQDKGFAYLSTFIDPWTRLTMMMGTSTNSYQIPNVPNAPINGSVTPAPFNSLSLNERQDEDTQFGVLALQRSVNGFDGQLSYFTRYDNLHFMPDPTGDLLLNGIASDISRQAYTNGVQGDASYIVTPAHTVRVGFTVSGEKTWVDNTSIVEPCTACDGTDSGPPMSITDDNAKVGWLAGIYAQDEWKITNNLTMNYGARFDQMWQYTDANQLSPRVNFTYKPFENTTFHAGYARYFTPPVQAEAAPADIALFNNTTGQVSNPAGSNPVLPERSHYFDAGVDQVIPLGCSSTLKRDCATLDIGLDGYYKIASDLLDNGQFGQALVLDAFNYAHGMAEGVELSAKYHNGGFDGYLNVAVSQEKATQPVTNQFLFDNTTPQPDLGGQTEFQYVNSHWIFTDHNQFVTGSAGASYQFCGRTLTPGELWWNSICGTKVSADMIYGSGLRNGDANISSERPYEQFNVGIARDFWMPDNKPVTLRFDVVNLADEIYQIRNGSGIGVFASQFGPRRGYFFGISKKL
ncbi:MAG: TonB-dependent receptor [Xanthobacteraceae bacterium]